MALKLIRKGSSDSADRLERARDELMRRFVAQLRAEFPELGPEPFSILADSFPEFLNAIAARLRAGTDAAPTRIPEIARQHAQTRQLLDFRLIQILTEYRILRGLLTDFLAETGALRTEDVRIVNAAVDQGIAHAAATFFDLAEQNQQECAERKQQLDAELNRSLLLLKALSDSTADALYVKDRDSRIQFLNPATEALIGKPASELLGKNELDWLSDRELAEIMLANDRKVMASGESHTVEEQVLTPDGRKTVLSTKSALHDPNGNVIGIVGVSRDITQTKRNLAELEKSEHRFRRLYDTKMIGLAFWTADGRVIDANDAILETLGYTREDLNSGINWINLTPPEFAPQDQQAVTEIQKKGYFEPYEKVLIAKNGRRVPVLIAGGSVENPKDSNIAVVIDRSVQIKTEENLRASEARLIAILESLPQAVYVTDASGKPIYANAMLEQIWGLRKMVALPDYHQYQGWSRKTGARYGSEDWPLARALQGEVIRNEIADVVTFDNQCKAIKVSANPVRGPHGENYGAVAINEDITQIEKLERASQLERQWLETVIDAIPTPIILIDKSTGRVNFFNKATTELTGGHYPKEPDEIYSGTIIEDESGHFLSSDQWPRSRAARGETVNGVMVYWRWKEIRIPLLVFARPVTGTPGHGDSIVMIYLDIRKLKETETQLRQAVQTRDDLLSIVSHDLKNPLSAIDLNAQLLATGAPAADRIREFSSKIRQTSSRMLELIENLLDVSRIETGTFEINPQITNAARVIQPISEELRTIAAGKRVHLEFALEATTEIVCDPARIAQVLANIIGNALKFAPPQTGTVWVTGRPESERFTITISDNGPGIADQDLPHIFDRFWHAKNASSGGTGLGLTIAKGIIESHHGRITVRSQSGSGSEFSFSVPRAHTPAGQELLAQKPRPQ